MTGRGLRGRRQAQLILMIAVAIDLVMVLLFVAQPTYIGPMSLEPPPFLWWLIPAVGIGVNLLGLAWLIRIYRADPEGGQSSWRLRRGRDR